MEFETKTIVTLGVCGALAFIIPISAMILYKIRHKTRGECRRLSARERSSFSQ
ncbi:MAG: hypothetical protein K2J80_00750 [Oscillospiraceae bacterium]|nr:hypothetical protein [Oscillospiraceae bacterium]